MRSGDIVAIATISQGTSLMLTTKEARVLIEQILELELAFGEAVRPSAGGLMERRTLIDERSHISLVESIPHLRGGRVARSKAEAVLALQRMNTMPLSMVQIWEDKEVVFWAEFTARSVRVLRHLGGEWEAALKQRQSVAANRAAA